MSYNAQLNAQKELQLQSKVRQETTKTAIEKEKEVGLRHKLRGQQHISVGEMWRASTEGVRAQIAQTGYHAATVQLATARVNLDTDRVLYGKAQDRLGYEQADRALTQAHQRATLTLKAISVTDLREQVRHQTLVSGGPAAYHLPKAGNAYMLPSVGTLPSQGYRAA